MSLARLLAVAFGLFFMSVVTAYIVVSLVIDTATAEPAPPTLADLTDVLGAPDDVYPGCLPIGSTQPSERTAVYTSLPDTLVFVCTRR